MASFLQFSFAGGLLSAAKRLGALWSTIPAANSPFRAPAALHFPAAADLALRPSPGTGNFGKFWGMRCALLAVASFVQLVVDDAPGRMR
jgi:hypothetical protein